jgi:hypothetical protein
MDGLPVLVTLAATSHRDAVHCSLACTAVLVAVAGGGITYGSIPAEVDTNSCLVKVWRLDGPSGDPNAQKPVTLEFSSSANAVALRPGCEEIAVGTGDGAVRIFPSYRGHDGPEGGLVMNNRAVGTQSVTVKYSPDGTLLLACRLVHSWAAWGVCTLYDAEMAVPVQEYVLEHNMYCSFSPAGDLLAVVTAESISLREVKPPDPVRMLSIPTLPEHNIGVGNDMKQIVSGSGATSAGTVALACGSRLCVWDGGGTLLLDTDLEEPIATNYNFANPVFLREDGKEVTCVLSSGVTMSVRELPSGVESFRLGPWEGKIFCYDWSADGRFCAVVGPTGGVVYDCKGVQLHAFKDEVGQACFCRFNPSSTRLATCGWGKCVMLRNTTDWSVTQTVDEPTGKFLCRPTFEQPGERVSYAIADFDESPNGVLIVRRIDDGFLEHRVVGASAGAGASFSADGNHILCSRLQTIGWATGPSMTIVSVETGEEVEWVSAFRCMALPAGDILSHTIAWRPSAITNSNASATAGSVAMLLHAAVGAQFYVVDAELARRAVEDSAWGQRQLINMSDLAPDAVPKLLVVAPHCINIRHPSTGDTVLHHYARQREANMIALWLSGEVRVTPIRNNTGHTALQVAILGHEKTIAKVLWRNLTSALNYVSAPLVTDELRTLAGSMPELVLSFLEDIEQPALRTLTTFRTALWRSEVIGLETLSLPGGCEVNEMGAVIPTIWSDLIGKGGSRSGHRRSTAQCLVASKVLMMSHFLGDRSRSPFHTIVRQCGSDVYESKLMMWCVQSKWETNVWPRLRVQLALYSVSLVLASGVMVASSVQGDEGVATDTMAAIVHVFQAVMMASELLSLVRKVFQLVCDPMYATAEREL